MKYNATLWFVGGSIGGLAVALVVLHLGGGAVVSRAEVERQAGVLAHLQEENRRLTEDLLQVQPVEGRPRGAADLPYDEGADARAAVAEARRQAEESRQFLMVTFGANWCLDCRTLYRHLKSDEVATYTAGLFRFAHVDVGKFNRNRELAAELGVDLSRGIPVAIFFDPSGRVIGTTNDGQLEPARHYSSKQILRFVRDIAERSRITAPDSVGG